MAETAPKPESDILRKARAELLNLQRENEFKNEKDRNPHWESINLDELTEQEAGFWRALVEARSEEDLRVLSRRLMEYLGEIRPKMEEERARDPEAGPAKMHAAAFLGLLQNKIQSKTGSLYHDDYLDRR